MPSDPPPEQPPTVLERTLREGPAREAGPREPPGAGRYALGRPLGAGGMGEVLEATDPALGRRIAFKRLIAGHQAGPEQVSRFLREARLTAQLSHPNIVPVHELAADERGEPYYTMKEVEGRTLADVLAGEPRPGLAGLLWIFNKAADAVAFAHARGVIHRDLKPANIMVGEFGEVLVMDWGLARRLGEGEDGSAEPALQPEHDEGLTLEGTVMGTPAYMSPEQAAGRVAELDARSDVWSLGAILYEVLTGEQPYEAR